MIEVIGVRFRGGCKEYYFDPRGISVEAGQFVIVETAQGMEFAQCLTANREVEEESVVQPLRPVVRAATENDRRTMEYNRKREKDAFGICRKKIAAHGLDMKLVRVECNFDGSKIVFFFTSEGRVDFRELVRDLAGVFRARIELRQIGVRDEAKMLGGLGICGRPFCCAQFLDDFVPVSIKMAKTQNLSLNPTKISGACGRLMCCLKYEQNAYEDAARRMPRNDSFVLTPDGPGNVSSVNLVKETVNVRLDDAPESQKSYHGSELRILRNGKGSREGIEIPAARPERRVKQDAESDAAFMPVFRTPDEPGAAGAPSARTADAQGEERRERRRGGRGRRGGHGGEARVGAKPAASAEKNTEKNAEKPRERGADRPADRRGGFGRRPAERKPSSSGAPGAPQALGAKKPPAGPSGEGENQPNRRSRHRGGRGRRRSGGEGAPSGE